MAGVDLGFNPSAAGLFTDDPELIRYGEGTRRAWHGRATTPLHLAILQECPGRVLELVEDRREWIHVRNKENRTPLSLCCELGGRKAYQCAQILLDYGAPADVVERDGFSPISIAEAVESGKMVLLLEEHASQELIAKERSFLLRKLAAHIHGVVATSFVRRPLASAYLPQLHTCMIENLEFFLDGDGASLFPSGERGEILAVMRRRGIRLSVEEIQRRLRARMPVARICSWNEHFFCLIFFGNILFVGNRGEGVCEERTVEAFVIDPKRIDEGILDTIDQMSGASMQEGAAFFYFGLPHKLSASRQMTIEEERLCFAVKRSASRLIKEDICCWAALKVALQISATCVLAREARLEDVIDKAMDTKRWCKRFSTALRKGSLEACEANAEQQEHPDTVFLEATRSKLERRIKKYPSHQGVRPLF